MFVYNRSVIVLRNDQSRHYDTTIKFTSFEGDFSTLRLRRDKILSYFGIYNNYFGFILILKKY